MEGTKKGLSKFSKGVLIYLGVLMLLLIGASVLSRFGYMLIWPEASVMGWTLFVFSLLVWGAISLTRKVKNEKMRKPVGFFFGVLLVSIGMFGFTFVSLFSQFVYPHVNATLKSQGKTVVLLRQEDSEIRSAEDLNQLALRMNTRRDEILRLHALQENPEELVVDQYGYPNGAYGYVYYAYPRVMGILIDFNAQPEGKIYRGRESQSKILYNWSEDGTLRIYLENPEIADSGEILLKP
jgi:hypothetical protein